MCGDRRCLHAVPSAFPRQGNRAGVVGCGFYNNNCGGLDLTLAWEIVYGSVAGMVVVILPFAIYFYEADDEVGKLIGVFFEVVRVSSRVRIVDPHAAPCC